MTGSGFSEPVLSDPAAQRAAWLRREKCRARRELGDMERRKLSGLIAKKLQKLPEYKEAKTLLCYVSYGSEADTCDLIVKALAEKKKVYCPKVEGDGLGFYRIFSLADLKPGYRSILEPEGRTERFDEAQDWERTVMLVPGTAFDLSGHRIGYGGGYYDRYLSGFAEGKRPFCIGLCFQCQLAEITPCAQDQDMDLVLFA